MALAIALSFLGGLASPAPALAASIGVTTFDDTILAGDGLCSLREAIVNANADSDNTLGDCIAGSGRDQIVLPQAHISWLSTAEVPNLRKVEIWTSPANWMSWAAVPP